MLNKRMDSIAGGKTTDNEILDARVDNQGNTHATLGAAMRSAEKTRGLWDDWLTSIVSQLLDEATGRETKELTFDSTIRTFINLNGTVGTLANESDSHWHTSEMIPVVAGHVYIITASSGWKKYVISRIHIQKRKNKDELFEMNYDDWRNAGSPKDDLLIGKRFVVKADISTFFPSIYTHSIPWALVGKAVAKQNRSKSKWFNKIDKKCQEVKYGETHGLLIGSHASNLISEMILTVVDQKLYVNRLKMDHINEGGYNKSFT